MINSEHVGKRIKELRKEKHVSQERMAEDLGMYQADISNLERAMGGSGINDLCKLDMIADYFKVSLIYLLTGSEMSVGESPSEIKKAEEYEMEDFVVADVRYGFEDEIYGAEVKLEAPDKSNIYVAFSELDGCPRFYNPNHSIYDLLFKNRGEPKREKELSVYCFLSGEDYIDIFRKMETKWQDVCRYLMFVGTENSENVEKFIEITKGKHLKEIEIPALRCEPEDLLDVDYSDLSVVYRYRLMVETNLKYPSAYSDMDNLRKREKAILEKLKAACASEEAYKVWKKDLIDVKFKEIIDKQHIVVCSYVFIGVGQYEEIMPEEMVDSFKCWIEGNGSAVFVDMRDANRREIRSYVAQHIADDLLGIE